MNIEKLQKAVAILNHDGNSGEVYGYHDQIELYPMAENFTKKQRDQLEALGFMATDCEKGWQCFT